MSGSDVVNSVCLGIWAGLRIGAPFFPARIRLIFFAFEMLAGCGVIWSLTYERLYLGACIWGALFIWIQWNNWNNDDEMRDQMKRARRFVGRRLRMTKQGRVKVSET